jgi:5-methylcytosine-specific restriction endonuclease McrA
MQEYSVLSEWSDETLAIWLRDGCRCVYCSVDMLQNRQHFVNLQHREHLLPDCHYKMLAKYPENIVLSRASCNSLKATWDPNKQAVGESQLVADDA